MKLNTPLPQPLPKETAKAARIFKSFVDHGNNGLDGVIPRNVLENAKGFAIFTVFKAGFLFSARTGSGIVVAKLPDGSWSAPSAIGTAGLGVGTHASAEMTDFLIVFNTQSAIKSFMTAGSLTLGGNLSIALGPLGRSGDARESLNTSRGLPAMYSYSKTKGLFGGISVEGSVIAERQDANAIAYHSDVSVKSLLSGAVPRPEWVQPLYQTLDSCTKFSGGQNGWFDDPPAQKKEYTFPAIPTSDEEQQSILHKKKKSGLSPLRPSNWADRNLNGLNPNAIPKFLQNTNDSDDRSAEVDHIVALYKSESRFRQPLTLGRDQAQDYVNTLNASLESIPSDQTRRQRLKCLRNLCGAFGILPSSFILADTLDGDGSQPFATGGFSRVYRMSYKGHPVAVKSLVVTTNGEETLQRMYRLLAREVIGWKWLQHENILPFVGVTPDLAIVSHLMEHGSIMEFIAKRPRHNRFHLLMGATAGLEYLHSQGVVHGDLKGGNILIDSGCSARLADFGLALIVEESTVGSTTAGHEIRGTTRWMAPELLYPEHYGFPSDCRGRLPSKGTDVYALGMATLEVLTRKRPFDEMKREATVIHRVTSGAKPDRPASGFSDELWNLLLKVWDPEYGHGAPGRPSPQAILNQMKADADNWDHFVVPLQRLQVEREESWLL